MGFRPNGGAATPQAGTEQLFELLIGPALLLKPKANIHDLVMYDSARSYWRLAVGGSACFLLKKLALPPNTIGGRNDEKPLISTGSVNIPPDFP
jgi:hypothetical protein